MKLQIKVGENGVIEEAVFKVFFHVVQLIIILGTDFLCLILDFWMRLSDRKQLSGYWVG